MKELTYTIAEPYSSADFLYGPLALIEYGFPAIVIAPFRMISPKIREFIKTLKEREAEVIVIGDDSEILALARIPLGLSQFGTSTLITLAGYVKLPKLDDLVTFP